MRTATLFCLISSTLATETDIADRPIVTIDDLKPNRDPQAPAEDKKLLDYFPNYHHLVKGIQNNSPKRCNVNPNLRINCGHKFLNKEGCSKQGCCWDDFSDGSAKCFYPKTDNTAKQEMSLATEDSTCLVQTIKQRKFCLGDGDIVVKTQEKCEAMGCCWDNTPGVTSPWCFMRNSASHCGSLRKAIDSSAVQFRRFYDLTEAKCTAGRESGSVCEHTCTKGIGKLSDRCMWNKETGRNEWILDDRKSCRYVQGCAMRDLLILDPNVETHCTHAMPDEAYGNHRFKRCELKCKQGYHFKQNIKHVSFCGYGMKWNHNYDQDEPLCEADLSYSCPTPYVENGKFYCTPDHLSYRECYLRCDKNHRLLAANNKGLFGYNIFCDQHKTQWTNMDPKPQCVPTYCDKFDGVMTPYNADYATCTNDKHTTGTKCTINCKNGFLGFGESEFKCKVDNKNNNQGDKKTWQMKWPHNTGKWEGTADTGMLGFCLDDIYPRCGQSAHEIPPDWMYVNSRRKKRDLAAVAQEEHSRQKRLAASPQRPHNEYPWTVALIDHHNQALARDDRHNETIDSRYICSGTWVSDEFVLTAAHCLRHMNRDFKTLSKSLWIYGQADQTKQLIREKQDFGYPTKLRGYAAVKIFVHNSYRNGQPYFDLALVKVKVSKNHGNQPTQVPPCFVDSYNNLIQGNTQERFNDINLHFCKVSSYGQHGFHPSYTAGTQEEDNFDIEYVNEGTMHGVQYQLIPEDQCEMLDYHTNRLDAWPAWASLPAWMKADLHHVVSAKDAGIMCAFGVAQILQVETPYQGACQGDSGAPLACFDLADSKWYLKGILTWGQTCIQTIPKTGDLFVDVENKMVIQWMLQVMNKQDKKWNVNQVANSPTAAPTEAPTPAPETEAPADDPPADDPPADEGAGGP
jgi:hypothetical protein